ncbi:AAA family ATPase [Pseudarthrobacter sp. CC4]|uniref:AAA family ATPase n=1 Tax=Pseudarthrobacter sp. CC4 TaxID=3029190 RepID=UPI003B8B777C
MVGLVTGGQVRLEWFEVRGFRAFGSEARRMDLTSNLVVIHAGNSQGKTSLAEAVEFLVTGRSSRRDLFGGAKAEYNESLRNAHLPADDPVWVAAGIRGKDGIVREVRRDLISDFSSAADCKSRLTVSGQEVSSLSILGIDTNEGAIAAPVLLQHTLRYVLSTEPKQRATYFKALLALSDLDFLRERVRAQATDLERVSPGPGLLALQRLSRTQLAASATEIQQLDGEDRQTLRVGVEKALLAAGTSVLGSESESIEHLRGALEQAAQERNDRVFPLSDFSVAPLTEMPVLPDISKYITEIRRADEVSAALLPVLTAVLRVPEVAHIDHPVDCPVCLTTDGLTPERITDIQTRLRDTTQLAAASSAAEKAVRDFRTQLQTWVDSVEGSIPSAAVWDESRELAATSAAASLGEDIPVLLTAALQHVRGTAADARKVVDAAQKVDAAAARLNDLIHRRVDIPATATLSLAEVQQSLSTFLNKVSSDEALTRLRTAVEPLLRTRLQSEGTQDLLHVLERLEGLVDDQYAFQRRMAALQRLNRADRSLKKAIGAVLDDRFATMSDAIMRWWGSIRPEELVGFAGVKRRAAGAIFVNLIAALQADTQADAVERDALGVFSDSQLNALGLSTFLARTELVQSPFVFLDDPIPGSDGDHRLTFCQNTLAGLLSSGMQVIVTTYDPKLAELAQTVNESWEPITYDLTLLNIAEGTEPAQTSDLFSNYMLQGEDGLNAPTAAGRRGACTAYRSAAERLAKQIIATNRTASGASTTVADIEREASMLGDLIPLLAPFTLSPDEKGKWQVIPKVLNPGNHDDGAPSTIELKQIRGNLRQIAKAHRQKWGSTLIR